MMVVLLRSKPVHLAIGCQRENKWSPVAGVAAELARTVPFSDRQTANDPRPAIAERYRDFADYQKRYLDAAEKLLAGRYLLAEELPRLKALCDQFQPLFAEPAPKPAP